MNQPYDDIINLPHHVSNIHPLMSAINRAAQFSPFAALTGYETALKETARLTDEQIELSESDMATLEMKLHILAGVVTKQPEIAVTYYLADTKKPGGTYVTVVGELKKIAEHERAIILINGEKIPLQQVVDISCELFASWA